MYRQILIHPEQTQFQRDLYCCNPEANIKDYELNTVTFELSYLTPPVGFIIVDKIIMQQIWKDKRDWDECLKPLTLKLNINPSYDIELHAFSYASEKTYGAALYVRIISLNEITSHLLSAKTNVTPKKNPCHWPTFVKNRVVLIVKKVGNENWFHVDSKNNPADLAVDNLLWWHGPSWLRQPREYWPQNIVTKHQHLEVQSFSVQTEPTFDILERFSDLPRAMRIISYWFKCLQYLKTRKCLYNTLDLTQSEMKFTRDRLVLVYQNNHISEYSLLSKGKPISSKSNLLTLNLFIIDSNGFVRINGRLTRPGLTFDERYHKILPYAARFNRLWKEEYLKELHRRIKWKYPQRDYTVGDLVVIRHDNLPPNEGIE
ncbi:hypothetical protein CVS40_11156 [Lucilia cuprina]|nr:hypothetical protein CVS40_11156 [Lucilia cuprina]